MPPNLLPRLQRLSRHPEFVRGARDMAAMALGLSAWGLVTGVAMVKSGLGAPLSVLMSLLVFAGSSQLAALPLLASGAPLWLIWATGFCVNLRFVIFSAQWRPYMAHLPRRKRLLLGYLAADLSFVVFMRRFAACAPAPGQMPYLLGGIAINWVGWQTASMIGIALAEHIPSHWGLGFAGTLALLAVTYSLVVDRSTLAAAGVAAAAAVASYALPLRLNLLVAMAAALAVGLALDAQPRRRREGDSA